MCQSLNGVLLNGSRLEPQQPTPVAESDTLQLDQPGKYLYRAVRTADRPPPAKRALSRSVRRAAPPPVRPDSIPTADSTASHRLLSGFSIKTSWLLLKC